VASHPEELQLYMIMTKELISNASEQRTCFLIIVRKQAITKRIADFAGTDTRLNEP
jgi:hypothetical protein